MIEYGTARRLVRHAVDAAAWCDAITANFGAHALVLPLFQLQHELRPFYLRALHRHIRPAHQLRVKLDVGDHVEPLTGALA